MHLLVRSIILQEDASCVVNFVLGKVNWSAQCGYEDVLRIFCKIFYTRHVDGCTSQQLVPNTKCHHQDVGILNFRMHVQLLNYSHMFVLLLLQFAAMATDIMF